MGKIKASVVKTWKAMHRPIVIKGKAQNDSATQKAQTKREIRRQKRLGKQNANAQAIIKNT